MISGLEKRMAGVQQDFTTAIHKVSEKENEKFDLIFAILSELQQRQANLEESVRSLKAQYGNGQCMGNQQMGNQNQMGNQMGNTQILDQMNAIGQMGNQGGSQGQLGNQANGQMFMQNQMNMGQQYGNMVAADGSQGYFAPMQKVVLVQAPQGMQQMGMQQMPQGVQQMQQLPYAMPQMMSGSMQPQLPQPYVSQDQSSNSFQQWGGTDDSQNAAGSDRKSGTPPEDQLDYERLPVEQDGQKAKQVRAHSADGGREIAT